MALGALGTPIITLAKVTGLDEMELSMMVGRQLPFFSVIVPFWLIWAFAGWRKVGRHIRAFAPQAIHISTEGPIGWSARSWCKARGVPFTSAFHTRFPDYASVRTGISAERLAEVERQARTALLGDALNYPMPQLIGLYGKVPGRDIEIEVTGKKR